MISSIQRTSRQHQYHQKKQKWQDEVGKKFGVSRPSFRELWEQWQGNKTPLGYQGLTAGANRKARRWQHALVSSQHIDMHLQEMAMITLSNFLFHLMAINPSFLHPGCSTTQIRHRVLFRGFFGTLFREKINSSTSSSS